MSNTFIIFEIAWELNKKGNANQGCTVTLEESSEGKVFDVETDGALTGSEMFNNTLAPPDPVPPTSPISAYTEGFAG